MSCASCASAIWKNPTPAMISAGDRYRVGGSWGVGCALRHGRCVSATVLWAASPSQLVRHLRGGGVVRMPAALTTCACTLSSDISSSARNDSTYICERSMEAILSTSRSCFLLSIIPNALFHPILSIETCTPPPIDPYDPCAASQKPSRNGPDCVCG
jgi:hypothetical protein